MTAWDYIFRTVMVLACVFLNGFFVAAEFAIVKVRSTQIDPLAAKGNLRARVAKNIIGHLDAYLSATQLGITMASLALGWIGEPFVAHTITPAFFGVGIADPQIIQVVSFALAFSLITVLHIVVGEQAPKWLAIQKAESTTLWVAYPLNMFFILFKPIIALLNRSANAILHIVGIEGSGAADRVHSEEELRLLLVQERTGSAASRNIVLNAMDFRKKQARHAMVPRREMVGLSALAPIKENIATMQNNKFSRYPIYKDSIDNIVGIVYTKDVFRQDKHAKSDFTLDSVRRDAIFLSETATLEQVLETIQQKKTHMIILADEFGGTAGLITLENVVEELVGNIQDELDREPPEVTRVSDHEFIVDGNVTTSDVEQLIGQEFSPANILSIGGYVVEQLGHIPKPNEVLRTKNLEFTIQKVENNAVETLLVKKLAPTEPETRRAKELKERTAKARKPKPAQAAKEGGAEKQKR